MNLLAELTLVFPSRGRQLPIQNIVYGGYIINQEKLSLLRRYENDEYAMYTRLLGDISVTLKQFWKWLENVETGTGFYKMRVKIKFTISSLNFHLSYFFSVANNIIPQI